MDISLTFDLRWAASWCQGVTSFIARMFIEQGGTALNYIHDFGGLATDEQMSTLHFGMLRHLLEHLGFTGATQSFGPRSGHDLARAAVQHLDHDSAHSMGEDAGQTSSDGGLLRQGFSKHIIHCYMPSLGNCST